MDKPRIIGESTPELETFLNQWYSPSPTIEAFTSGSTGTPKKINLLKSDMVVSASETCREFSIGRQSNLALPLSVGYIAGKMMVVRAIVSGATLWVEKPSNDDVFATLPTDVDFCLASIVPSQISATIAAVGRGVRLNALLVGGAPVSAQAEADLLQVVSRSFATYGMTETCSNVALRRFGDDFYEANNGITFDVDDRGCLVVESTAMSFGRLTTNDIVEIVPLTDNKKFRWIGRYDNVINSGGVKLYPEQIERKLGAILPAETFYVASRPSEKWGSEVVAYVEAAQMPDAATVALVESRLERYERPKAWIAVDKLPRTSTGKIKR